MNRKTVFLFASMLLLLAFVAGTLLYRNSQSEQAAATVAQNMSALVRDHAPSLGNPEAKVHIVEFFDPACETCRSFYPFVKQMMAAHPDRIRLSVRYAPFHQGSDGVVKMLEAARKQGKYWQALEALLAAQANWVQHHTAQPELAWKHLDGLGLNLEQLWNDASAPEIARLVAQDLEDARTLKVSKTPEFFVNGRPMPSFGYEQLQGLVEEELAKAYR